MLCALGLIISSVKLLVSILMCIEVVIERIGMCIGPLRDWKIYRQSQIIRFLTVSLSTSNISAPSAS